MKRHQEHSNLLQFDILAKQDKIEHFCTTRKGGVSKGPFSSLNLGNYSDDNPIAIHENLEILARMWYMNSSDFIIPHQTHSNNVLVVNEELVNASLADKIDVLYGVDATITDMKNIFLCATTADCVPILLYDKEKQVIAAIHAGWKGIVSNIIANTFNKMQKVYGTDASHIIAAIGPAISQKNYEVGDELIEKFKRAGFDLSGVTFVNEKTGKWHIDLKHISKNELEKLGVLSEQIEVSTLCTYDESDLFFSARRQSVVSGRMLTGIMMH